MSHTTLLRVRGLARKGIRHLESTQAEMERLGDLSDFQRLLMYAKAMGEALGYFDAILSEAEYGLPVKDVTPKPEPRMRLVNVRTP